MEQGQYECQMHVYRYPYTFQTVTNLFKNCLFGREALFQLVGLSFLPLHLGRIVLDSAQCFVPGMLVLW